MHRFLAARFVYYDAVSTVIVVWAVFATQAVGLTPANALTVLLVFLVVALLASFGWGYVADRWGPKRTLMAILVMPVVGLVPVGLVPQPSTAIFAAVVVGVGIGGVNAVDRLIVIRLAPPARLGAMLGLYGLVGRFSAFLGPILYGLIVASLLGELGRGAYQLAILTLPLLVAVGLVILSSLPEPGSRSVDAASPV